MEAITGIDHNILLYFQENIQQTWLTPIMTFITHLGTGGALWIALTVIMLFFRKTRPVAVACAAALLIDVVVVNVVIKPIVARPRPYDLYEDIVCLIKPQWDYSFPSGHAAASLAAAGVYPLMKVKKRYSIPLLVLAFLICFSRIYVCVHYPSDVVCGIVIGCFCAVGGWLIYQKWLIRIPLLAPAEEAAGDKEV
ncbi:MAG: phosphatase PAP2 family protein [Lachnospiraceae bacterium]|nr:phosphatase PAP2 family protein [Lachnospiraceae bacterium]